MKRRVATALLVAAGLALSGAGPASASARSEAAGRATDWLMTQQKSNGTFGSDRADYVAETIAAGIAGGAPKGNVDQAISYIGKHGWDDATRGALTGRIIAGIVAAGRNPRSFSGHDYVEKLRDQYDDATGAYDDDNFFSHFLAANGALAAKEPIPSEAIAYITDRECTGGGFGYENDCSTGPDVDTTAWAINVLVGSGHRGDAVTGRARAFLASEQKPDGGFAITKDLPTSSDSTGLALTAIEALGESATASPWEQSDGDDPVQALRRLQSASGGFPFVAGGKAKVSSTTNAIPGLAKTAYPIRPRAASSPAPTTAPTERPSNDNEPRAADDTTDPPAAGADPVSTGAPRQKTETATPTPRRTGDARSDVILPASSGTPLPQAAPFSSSSDASRDDPGFPALAWAGIAIGLAGTAGALAWNFLRMRGR